MFSWSSRGPWDKSLLKLKDDDFSTCKVLVLGDFGVGKTSFVNLLTEKSVVSNLQRTCGCNLQIFKHQFDDVSYFIELWDIGANPKFKKSRKVFYPPTIATISSPYKFSTNNCIQGLILVYDLSNGKSFVNLFKWIREVQGLEHPDAYTKDQNIWVNENFNQLPVLVVGNKLDLAKPKDLIYLNSFRDELGIENTITVSSLDLKWITSKSVEFTKICIFFDKCIIYQKTQNVHKNNCISKNNHRDNVSPYSKDTTTIIVRNQWLPRERNLSKKE